MCIDTIKPFFWVSNKATLKPVCSATETSLKIEISLVACLDMIISKGVNQTVQISADLHLCCSPSPTKVFLESYPRLGMSVTTQGGSGRQCVTGPGRNTSKYRFVLLMCIVFGRLKTQ